MKKYLELNNRNIIYTKACGLSLKKELKESLQLTCFIEEKKEHIN